MKQLILHNVRSHYNVGAMFRTADGAGVSKLFLVGVTPSPIDRFGRTVQEIHKTALGAELEIPWEKVDDLLPLIKKLQSEKVFVVAVEQSQKSVSLDDFIVPDSVAYIMGSETEGLPEEVLEIVDGIVEIPMGGKKESLNVSVAAGIVLYHK